MFLASRRLYEKIMSSRCGICEPTDRTVRYPHSGRFRSTAVPTHRTRNKRRATVPHMIVTGNGVDQGVSRFKVYHRRQCVYGTGWGDWRRASVMVAAVLLKKVRFDVSSAFGNVSLQLTLA